MAEYFAGDRRARRQAAAAEHALRHAERFQDADGFGFEAADRADHNAFLPVQVRTICELLGGPAGKSQANSPLYPREQPKQEPDFKNGHQQANHNFSGNSMKKLGAVVLLITIGFCVTCDPGEAGWRKRGWYMKTPGAECSMRKISVATGAGRVASRKIRVCRFRNDGSATLRACVWLDGRVLGPRSIALKIGLPKIRLSRKLLFISIGILALLAGTGAAALYVGAAASLTKETPEDGPAGTVCDTVETMVLKTPAKRLWLRKIIRMQHADGPARIKTALRVAGLLANANQVDLIQ
eukprot:gene8807-11907_t